jgi:GNAT superfamily N-acetyltransferase
MGESMHVDGTTLTIRPVEIADVERLNRMFGQLSPDSIYFRFFSPLPTLPRSTLLRLAGVDHWHRDALVAVNADEIVGLAGYDQLQATTEPELSVAVQDAWHRHGIGLRLTTGVMELARARGHTSLVARVLPGNRAALGLIRKLAPDAEVMLVDGEYEARLPLHTARQPRHNPARPRMSA